MTEKRCHICGNEVRENYYLDKEDTLVILVQKQ